MPYAVTHILIPLILVAILRDLRAKKFSLHYAFIAGFGGILPDIDILISIFLKVIGTADWQIHKTFTHSVFFPLIFLVLFLITKPINKKARVCNIGRHKLSISLIFLALSFGTLMHIVLDTTLGAPSYLFYPFSETNYSLDIFGWVSNEIYPLVFPLLDGFMFILWLIYLEWKHKISDFI
ncbi:MAG: metal-dependent hydrolase [Candidatus Pacearchaeota archaeon]